MDVWVQVLIGLVPSIGVGILFYLAIRALVNADRNERRALTPHDDTPGRGSDRDSQSAPRDPQKAPRDSQSAPEGR